MKWLRTGSHLALTLLPKNSHNRADSWNEHCSEITPRSCLLKHYKDNWGFLGQANNWKNWLRLWIFFFFCFIDRSLFHYLKKKKKNFHQLVFSISVRVGNLKSCYFTGDMRKVDWQRKSTVSTERPTVVATLSLDTLSIRGLPSSTRPDWRGRVQGKENASFGRASSYVAGSYRWQNPNGFSRYFYANSHR